MSAPRRVVPGATYLLTRRCFGRQFLLRPCAEVNRIFKFCLAVASERTGVVIHAYSVLSNHYHVVATDPNANLPAFMHWLNEYVAKCINARLGRWESLWAPGSYSAVTLVDSEAVSRALLYTYANPVEAGLVQSYSQWPGARSLLEEMGRLVEVAQRPDGFFRENGPVPETATLRLVPPPAFEDNRSSWLSILRERLREREREIRARLEEEGRRFLGLKRVLRQSPFGSPRSAEPRRRLNPRVAAPDKWKRIESLQRLKSFVDAYRVAWLAFSDGARAAMFPFGTYAMRVRFGVTCSDP